jgi:hypothetical protein
MALDYRGALASLGVLAGGKIWEAPLVKRVEVYAG